MRDVPAYVNENITDYTELVVDEFHGQLLVGSRDVMFRLNLTDLAEIQHVTVQPKDYIQSTCKMINTKVCNKNINISFYVSYYFFWNGTTQYGLKHFISFPFVLIINCFMGFV